MDSYINRFIEIGCLRPGELRNSFAGVTLHEKNGGRGEDAAFFAKIAFNSKNRNKVFSSHYYVDDVQVIYTLPEKEVALHSTEYANSNTIAVTLCTYIDCDAEQLIANAENLITDILVRNGIVMSGDKIFKAEDFTEQAKYEQGLLDSENRFATLAKNIQKNLLSQSNTTEVTPAAIVLENEIDIPFSIGTKSYPPADTESESSDVIELSRYRNLDLYGGQVIYKEVTLSEEQQ